MTAVEAGLGTANSSLIADRKEPALYCPPAKLGLTPSQISSIFDDFLKEHPQTNSDIPVSIVLLFALQRTFPCDGH